MARATLMAASSLMVLLLVVPSVFGVDHTVGGSNGWTQGQDYSTWAAGETFTVGDNLVFNYGSSHAVDQVSESDYSSCSSSNAIKSYTGGSTTIALTTAGKMYFICPTAGHCPSGMKLAITVAAASGSTPVTPTTPSTPESPSTPSTPSPSSPSTNSSSTPSGNGAVGGSGSVMQLLGSLVVSVLVLALMC